MVQEKYEEKPESWQPTFEGRDFDKEFVKSATLKNFQIETRTGRFNYENHKWIY